MKKNILIFVFLLTVIFSFPKFIVGGYFWSDIFIGFEGYSVYGGLQNDIPIEKIYDLEKIGFSNDLILIKNDNVIGISYVGFDSSVLGDGTFDFGSYALNLNSKASIGLEIINFTIFGYKVIPALYVGIDINYFFDDIAKTHIEDSLGFALSDNLSVELIYGLNSIFEPIKKDSDFIIIPKFFPWPLLIGAEVLF
jgi:hypothetical protein